MGLKRLLHAGCGSKTNKPPWEFSTYKETRLDCNSMVCPEIIASIVAMPMIADESYDGVFCSHCLEHLFTHEVAMALAEFNRVLKPGGKLLVYVPDLQTIGSRLALDQADQVIYQSHIGMITPLDMLYGHRGSVGAGNLFMGHKCGFTQTVLKTALQAAGFGAIKLDRETQFELKAWACKPEVVDASQERSPEAIPECDEGPCLGEGPSLRQSRQVAGACRQEETAQA